MAAGLAHLVDHHHGTAGRGTNGTRIQFAMVYVQEAHAEDEWPIGTPSAFRIAHQHRTRDERAAAVRQMCTELPPLAQLPWYADDMGNGFQDVYGAWPTRMYLFADGVLQLKAEAVDAAFDLMQFWETVQAMV
eukprot:m.377186 g.377186  ORF g.377186 m.377186 type:complete len:133 (-) comp20923_c0_seq87:4021-4419(-)